MSASTILYGIGAQKSATTWLHTQFKLHPTVHLPPAKELHYWDTIRAPFTKQFRNLADFRAAEANRFGRLGPLRPMLNKIPEDHRRDRNQLSTLLHAETRNHQGYLSYLTDGMSTEATIAADITPSYALLSEKTFSEMAAVAPDTKFLMILRDPVTRLASGLRHTCRQEIKRGMMDHAKFEAAFDEALEMGRSHPAYLRSDYKMTFERLFAAVPANAVHVMFYETMFSADAMAQLAAFLGIDPISADFKEQVYKTQNDSFVPRPEQLAKARGVFSAVYDDVAARFGAAVPSSWGAALETGAAE